MKVITDSMCLRRGSLVSLLYPFDKVVSPSAGKEGGG